METIARSFRLMKICFGVLSHDKELLVFPFVSGIALVFALPSLFLAYAVVGSAAFGGLAIISAFFGYYVLAYFVVIFFNSALVYAANVRLSGGDPTIKTGLAGAVLHFWSILGWAIVSATVGLILRLISNKAGIVGQIAVSILGMAWSMGTYFVVPLLVIEGNGFRNGISSSMALFKRTWGEQVAGGFGLGFAQIVFILLAFALVFGLSVALQPLGDVGVFITVFVGIAAVGSILLVFSALDGIYKAALYRYATTGESSPDFPEDVVRDSWRRR